MINVRLIRLGLKLQSLPLYLNGTPGKGGRDLQGGIFLRGRGIVAQRNFSSNSQPVLFRLNSRLQIVAGKRECFPIESKALDYTGAYNTQNTQPHVEPLES